MHPGQEDARAKGIGATTDSSPSHDGTPTPLDSLLYRLHCFNRDSTTYSLLIYRRFQGFLVTGQHSGTHWIKWMLSHAIAHHYGVPPPRYYNNNYSNDIIGHPRHERIHPQLPRIASTHSIPPYALEWAWVRRCFRLPPYVLVVRDMRNVMISNYEKWRHKYQVPFSEYLRGDPRAKTYFTDPWNYTHFLNRWGEVATRFPEETLVLRYEDFRRDKAGCLARVARHFSLPLGPADLKAGADAGTKENMTRHHNPAVRERPVRPDGAEGARYTAQDMELLRRILGRHLRHDFGYDYFDSPRGFQAESGPRLFYTPPDHKTQETNAASSAKQRRLAVRL